VWNRRKSWNPLPLLWNLRKSWNPLPLLWNPLLRQP